VLPKHFGCRISETNRRNARQGVRPPCGGIRNLQPTVASSAGTELPAMTLATGSDVCSISITASSCNPVHGQPATLAACRRDPLPEQASDNWWSRDQRGLRQPVQDVVQRRPC
jgi:hypothetical protein